MTVFQSVKPFSQGVEYHGRGTGLNRLKFLKKGLHVRHQGPGTTSGGTCLYHTYLTSTHLRLFDLIENLWSAVVTTSTTGWHRKQVGRECTGNQTQYFGPTHTPYPEPLG